MKLAAKLALAAKDCGYVQKDGNNAFHRYRYASAAAILGHVNAALCEHGLAVVETMPEIVSVEGTGKDRIVTARVTLVVGDTESDERATFRGLGSGMDSGDKAVMKAITAASKYAWMLAFSISTGDDPEADESTDQRTSQGDQRRNDTPRKPAQQRPAQGQQQPGPAQGQQQPGPAQGQQPANERPDIDRDVKPSNEPQEELPPALVEFNDRMAEIELPGEGVAVWMKHRGALAELTPAAREAAWDAICARVERVGKLKNAKTWLKKAIQAEEERRHMSSAHGGAA